MKQSSDLATDLAAVAAEERRRLGAPPTAAQLLALRDGLLAAEEAEKIRQQLAVDSALANRYLEIKREDKSGHTGDSGQVSKDAVDRAWLELSNRLRQEVGAGAKASTKKRLAPLWLAAAILCVALAWGWLRSVDSPGRGSPGEYQRIAFSAKQFRGSEIVMFPGLAGLEFTFTTALVDLTEAFDAQLVKADLESVVFRGTVSRQGPALRVEASRLEVGKTYQWILQPRNSQADSPEMVMTFRVVARK